MDRVHLSSSVHDAPTAVPEPVREAPVPRSPVALGRVALGLVTVGHAEDHAERDADARADVALDRLRTAASDASPHEPGCAHVRRSSLSPPSGVEVGLAGGTLGARTSEAITARRGGGRRLEEPVLRRMQTAFRADFSAVRIHDDAVAASLNDRVSARAFTTGRDIFFGAGQYAPGTADGERTLAHELAHTLQPAEAVRRTVDQGVGAIPVGAVATAREALGVVPAQRGPAAPGPVVPRSLAELEAMTAEQVSALAAGVDYSRDGALMSVLTGPLEADWFKAKECLVFDMWPGGEPDVPAPLHAARLLLMKGLIRLRDAVHARVCAKVEPAVRARIGRERAALAAVLAAAPPLGRDRLQERADRLARDEQAALGELITFLPPGGADSVTSDIDVSTKGSYTEWGVELYNALFRQEAAVPFDAGTVFDLNVYAKDWIFFQNQQLTTERRGVPGGGTLVTTTIAPGTENPQQEALLGDGGRAAVEADQETWSLVHVARFLDRDGWAAHTAEAMGRITDPQVRRDQEDRFAEAWDRAAGFHARMEATMQELAEAVAPAGASGWRAEDQAHHAEGAVRMRAANKIYEAELARLRQAREELAFLRGRALSETDQQRMVALLQDIPRLVSQASLYANEVYGSGGATVHAVIGMQFRKKKQRSLQEGAGPGEQHVVNVALSASQWYQTFNDNLGDVLKDYEHLGVQHGSHAPHYWYAAFKMGKYVDRMLDAVPHLAEGGGPLLSGPQTAQVLAMPELVRLRRLADNHVEKKAGVAESDPKQLAQDAFFGDYGKPQVDEVKADALKVWSTVRGMVSAGPAPDGAGPEEGPTAGATATATSTRAATSTTTATAGGPASSLKALVARTTELARAVDPS